MRILFIGCLPLFALLTACSSHDAVLEKDLNSKIDKYGEAVMKVCECVEAEESDCEQERQNADAIYEELNVVNELETEKKIDPEVYSDMLESIALINGDYSTCRRALYNRLNAE